MDIAQELEGTFKVPSAVLAFLAIIIGILVLFFPYILNILIAFFLIVWGLMKAFELGSKPSQEFKATESSGLRTNSQNSRGLTEEDLPSSFEDSDTN